MTSGWVGGFARRGAGVCIAAGGWGAAVVLLGFAPGLAVAAAALVLAGFCDMVSGILRSAIANQTIPDRLRGRLAGIEQISYSAGPLLGNVEAGAVASLAGVRASIVSGGLLCVAGVAIAAAALPVVWRFSGTSSILRIVSHDAGNCCRAPSCDPLVPNELPGIAAPLRRIRSFRFVPGIAELVRSSPVPPGRSATLGTMSRPGAGLSTQDT